jgi:hypothetical protein
MHRTSWTVLIGGFVVGLLAPAGCEGTSSDTEGAAAAAAATSTGGQGGTFDPGEDGGGAAPQCLNLQCQQVVCDGGGTTTVSGTVYDPSGTLPLYNIGVYVPNAPLDPVPDTLSCDKCDATFSGSPLVSAITDTEGKFTLENVPVGADIPLVIQVGKWRRQITIPAVDGCVDNPLTDPQVTRLPKSMAEGNLPRIALTTGEADPLFCLLRRLGIDDNEYGIAGSEARIHFFQGANGAAEFDSGFGASPGATLPSAETTLWNTDWANYDIVLLSCEGAELPGPKDGHRVALRDYIDVGGRVFATHYHYNWFQGDAPADLSHIATFTSEMNQFDNELVDIDQTFPKGVALADWMTFVDGSSPHTQFIVFDGRRHTLTVDETHARIWVRYLDNTEYFSFNAPIETPEADQCGRMVFSDIHVSAGAGDPQANAFPSACTNDPLTEQEKALIFMFFDLSACIIPDDHPVCPPGQANCGGTNDPVCPGTCVNGCCTEIPQ